MGEKRTEDSLLAGRPEGKRAVRKPRHRWVGNIKMNLVEMGWGSVDRIGLDQDRGKWRALLNVVMNFQVP
jgi:hypothetical protein